MSDEFTEIRLEGSGFVAEIVLGYSDEHTTDEGLEFVAQWNASRLRSNDLNAAMSTFVENCPPSVASRHR